MYIDMLYCRNEKRRDDRKKVFSSLKRDAFLGGHENTLSLCAEFFVCLKDEAQERDITYGTVLDLDGRTLAITPVSLANSNPSHSMDYYENYINNILAISRLERDRDIVESTVDVAMNVAAAIPLSLISWGGMSLFVEGVGWGGIYLFTLGYLLLTSETALQSIKGVIKTGETSVSGYRKINKCSRFNHN